MVTKDCILQDSRKEKYSNDEYILFYQRYYIYSKFIEPDILKIEINKGNGISSPVGFSPSFFENTGFIYKKHQSHIDSYLTQLKELFS